MTWEKACGDEKCAECGEQLEEGEDIQDQGGDGCYCEGCWDDREHDDEEWYDDRDGETLIDGVGFADPGGNSSLRAETPTNPRNLPCPTCGEENRLTPLDQKRGYQCNTCADRCERGADF